MPDKSSLYDTLGVPKDAKPDQIKRAYRRKAQKAHPDKGGTQAGFLALQLAFDVLGDPERKARYDQDGQTSQQPSVESQALAYLAQVLLRMVDTMEPATTKVVEALKSQVQRDIQAQEDEIRKIDALIGRRREAVKRMSPGAMPAILEADIGRLDTAKRTIGERLDILKEAMNILKDQEYRSDAPVAQRPIVFYSMN